MAKRKELEGAAPAASTVEQAEKAGGVAHPAVLVVAQGYTVFWPLPGLPFRAGEGAAIRADDPFIVKQANYPDQHYKLLPAQGAAPELEPVNNRIIAQRVQADPTLAWLPLAAALLPSNEAPPLSGHDTEGAFSVPPIDEEPPRGV